MSKVESLAASCGSPPREWGQHPAHQSRLVYHGFTPTRVGTAPTGGCGVVPAPVHPPREWGQPGSSGYRHGPCGFTPHASGDSYKHPPFGDAGIGSPPREWGQQCQGLPKQFLDGGAGRARFTPTRVGTAAGQPGCPAAPTGSPPREWGQHFLRHLLNILFGFTPTRVGTAFPPPSAQHPLRVHPHASGDSALLSPVDYTYTGSPPREWGQHIAEHRRGVSDRFTPTRVGTARKGLGPTLYSRVHPHASGDSYLAGLRVRHVHGSPPREWGQQERHRHTD